MKKPFQLLNLQKIRQAAQHSADEFLGPQSNPHDEGSQEFKIWIDAYYARVLMNSMETAA